MGERLNGSAKTGEKIIKNRTDFSYSFVAREKNLYRFNWSFNSQFGHVSIIFNEENGKISNSSLIDTANNSKYKFDRPLGLYNDNSLFNVFVEMMKSQGINVIGIYAA